MADKKHIGEFDSCPFCLRYIHLGDTVGDPNGYRSTCRKLHRIAINRRAKDQVYADLGMIKVKGNLGGTYYE